MTTAAIRTQSGRLVDLFALTAADVDIDDIAHALAHVCRWSGHVRTFYSVAEHSVRVADLVWQRSWSRDLALTALLHDATEAYLGDMVSPLKSTTWAAPYRALEDRVAQAIAARFGTSYPIPASVKTADLILLATEARDLMPADCTIDAAPLAGVIEPWIPEHARQEFIHRYRSLTTPARALRGYDLASFPAR